MPVKNTPDHAFLFRHKFRIRPDPSDQTERCRICKSPFHPASGSEGPEGITCGACVRSLIQCLYEVAHPSRSVKKVKFYIHATVPPLTNGLDP
jgi:hypothetical protein